MCQRRGFADDDEAFNAFNRPARLRVATTMRRRSSQRSDPLNGYTGSGTHLRCTPTGLVALAYEAGVAGPLGGGRGEVEDSAVVPQVAPVLMQLARREVAGPPRRRACFDRKARPQAFQRMVESSTCVSQEATDEQLAEEATRGPFSVNVSLTRDERVTSTSGAADGGLAPAVNFA
ncbi:MAG: hypothetical protein Q8N26_34245 [Myxococcales bacterium]|nr:hypothetical protein [Myxococcales bacterium]